MNDKPHRNQAGRFAVYLIILPLIQSQGTISTPIVWKERTGTHVRGGWESSEQALGTFLIMFHVCAFYISLHDNH